MRKQRNRPFLIGLVLMQMMVLVLFAGSYYLIDSFGDEIVLETEPIDPRDLFYGDYVILNYTVSTLPTSMVKDGKPADDEDTLSGKRVYVTLKRQGEVDVADGIYLKRSDVPSGSVVLRARVQSEYAGNLHLSYGLERYYVPEGTGGDLERATSPFHVTIRATSWGQSKIISLEET